MFRRPFALSRMALRHLRPLALRPAALQLIFVGVLAAQEQPKPKELPDAPVAKQESSSQRHENAIHSTIGILGRRSLFFPDLATNPRPLRPIQKFELFADNSIAPSGLVAAAFVAGISQAKDSLPGYGQGMEGYGKRIGAITAATATSHFFGTFLIPSMLHDDPRYFVAGHGGAGHRIGYAVSRLFITRTDRGTQAANWGGLLGPLFAETIANSYLPLKEQTGGRTLQRYGVRIGFVAAGNLAKEYWPTIFRSLRFTRMMPSSQSNPRTSSTPPPAGAGTPPQP